MQSVVDLMGSLGYFIAREFPVIGNHIEALIVVIVTLSVSPAAIEWLRQRRKKRA